MNIGDHALIFGLVALAVGGIVIWKVSPKLNDIRISVLRDLFTFRGRSSAEQLGDDEAQASNPISGWVPDSATRILRWVQRELEKVNGDYVLSATTHENSRFASRLYNKLNGEIVATCFFESPYYDPLDYATLISEDSIFRRITIRAVCDESTQTKVEEKLKACVCRTSLTVIEDPTKISMIGGIFARLADGSHLAFLAMDNYGDSGENKGLLFSGALAKQLFEYYRSFTRGQV